MREIKFRAWDKEKNRMMPVKLMDWCEWRVSCQPAGIKSDPLEYGERNSFSNQPTDRHIVMQYTGLKDKNGKEIYEGDIVYARCCEKYLEVYWNDIGCGGWWFAEKIDGDMYCVGKIDLDWLEVKGNIHDNPELLEV